MGESQLTNTDRKIQQIDEKKDAIKTVKKSRMHDKYNLTKTRQIDKRCTGGN